MQRRASLVRAFIVVGLFVAGATATAVAPHDASAQLARVAPSASLGRSPTSVPRFVVISNVKYKALSSPYVSGPVGYDVELLNTTGNTVAVKLSLQNLATSSAQRTVTDASAPPGKSTVTLRDATEISDCFKSMVNIAIDDAPPIRAELKSNCTYETLGANPYFDEQQTLDRLSFRGAHLTDPLKCGTPASFETFVHNRTNAPIKVQIGIREPVRPLAGIETLDVPPGPPITARFRSASFRGDVGLYKMHLRDTANKVETYDPGWSLKVSQKCNPEILQIVR